MESPSSLETRYRAAQHASNPSLEHGYIDDTPAQPAPPRRVYNRVPKLNMNKLGNVRKWVIIAAALAAVLAIGGVAWGLLNPRVPGVESDKYQAVFLVDGTQYVGKLTRFGSGYYKLSNAYFVTASAAPVASDESSQQNVTGQIALMKLETGLLSAENEMTIPKDKVLLYENLKPEGHAAQLIDNNK